MGLTPYFYQSSPNLSQTQFSAGLLTRASNRVRFASLLAALVCIVLMSGCLVVPVKTKTVIQTPSGLKEKLPDFAIVPGQTTRGEVEAQYKSFTVDSGSPNLYWARFRKSTWALFVGAGGPGGAAVGGGRMWGVYNLLVRFDSSENVQASETFQDNVLLGHLAQICKEQNLPGLDLTQPVDVGGPVIPVEIWSYDVRLSANQVIVTRQKPPRLVHKKPQPQPPEIAVLPLAQFTGLQVGNGELADSIPVSLRFSQKTRFGKQISFRATPSAVLTLVRWQQQVEPARTGK